MEVIFLMTRKRKLCPIYRWYLTSPTSCKDPGIHGGKPCPYVVDGADFCNYNGEEDVVDDGYVHPLKKLPPKEEKQQTII